jgi:tetratricopeptide (TPR) repeat protein
LTALGEEQSRKGENSAAETSLREAISLAERLRDPAPLTRIVLALPAWHWPGPGEANPLALLLAQRALVLDREDGPRRSILMARLAAELSYDPGYQVFCTELSAGAMEQALALKDPKSELYVRLYRDPVLSQPEQVSERLANAEEILRLGIEAGDYGACVIAAFSKSNSLMTIGDIAAADRAAEFAMGIVPTSQIRFHHGLSTAYRAYREVAAGRFANAAHKFDRCSVLAVEDNFPHLLDACWPTMLIPYIEEGRLPELRVIAEDTVRRRPSVLVYSALLSWLNAQLGRSGDASFFMERLAADEFANLSRSAESLVGLAAMADVCAILGRQDYASILHDKLVPYAGMNVMLNAVANFGSVERYLGILDSLMGRLDEAIRHFEKSFNIDRKSGMRPWAVYSGIELLSSLARRRTAEDRGKAPALMSSLEIEATGLKMTRALAKLNETRELFSGDEVAATESRRISITPILERTISGAEDDSKRNEPSMVYKEDPETNGVRSKSGDREQENGKRVAIFCRYGEYWEVGYEGRTSSLRHRRGLELISFLVRHPERECLALELAREGELQSRALGPEDREVCHNTSAPLLDAEAKRSYRQRLLEIRNEVEILREANDFERAAKLEEEQDFLTRELARALGLFGRDRKFGSDSERARKRISIAVTRAIQLISVHDANFGGYLKRSIKTGNFCLYSQDPGNPLNWKL